MGLQHVIGMQQCAPQQVNTDADLVLLALIEGAILLHDVVEIVQRLTNIVIVDVVMTTDSVAQGDAAAVLRPEQTRLFHHQALRTYSGTDHFPKVV